MNELSRSGDDLAHDVGLIKEATRWSVRLATGGSWPPLCF